MENKDETFNYTYSARQQEEIKRIRQKYTPPEENKMEQLRMLDKSAAKLGTIASIAIGVLGTFALGIGMCFTMVWVDYFALGIAIGVPGIAGIVSAYPIFRAVTKRQRQKLAPQIIALTEELMGGNR